MPPDTRRRRLHRIASFHRTTLVILSSALCACATPTPHLAAPPVAPTASLTTPIPMPVPAPSTPPAPPRVQAREPETASLLESVLTYAERLRLLSPAELATEQLQLADPGPSVERQMQLTLALLQSHQATDTLRAQILLQRLMANNSPDAIELRALARLLSSRVQDVRRLEDLTDRQAQQLREAQRRIEVLNDRLEAMRAIERSLTPRTTPGSPRPQP